MKYSVKTVKGKPTLFLGNKAQRPATSAEADLCKQLADAAVAAPKPTYRDDMLRTMDMDLDQREKMTLGALGLAGEAGEVADLVKKVFFHDHALDNDALVKELGDVRWYFELLCYTVGTTIEEVEAANIAKRKERYPNGFNAADSVNRKT